MLEKNLLYRRMQNKDIFRTFSRAYSRQHHQRSQRTYAINSTVDNLNSTPTNNINSLRIVEDGRSFTASQNVRRDWSKGKGQNLHIKTQQFSQKSFPFSQTVNLNTITSNFSRKSSHPQNSYLSDALGKRKESDSLLVNIHGRNKRENFRLKACMQRENEHYEGHHDETQFSILELQRQAAMKKGWIAENAIKSAGIFKPPNYGPKKIAMQKTKKASHVFSKYTCLLSPQKIKIVSRNSQLE